MEIVPNPFGGVNTHLLDNEAYIVGIVPQPMPFYTLSTEVRRPESPEWVWRLEQNLDGFPKESNSILVPGLLRLTI